MPGTEIIDVSIPRTIFGLGAINNIGSLIRSFNPGKPIIVTDKGIIRAGLIGPIKKLLKKAGYKTDVFDKCGIEAPVSSIEELVTMINHGKYDLLIGVGGGSNMDTTKAASLLAANKGLSIQDLIEGNPVEKSIPKILIPTTAGTGSEWSSAAVITTDTQDNKTFPYLSASNYPDAVIIDPDLTKNLPQKITADTGMDALTHAIEAYTSCRANIISDMFSSTAIKLISGNIRQAFAKGSVNMDARYSISIAASFAMLAASVGGLGIAHFMNVALGKKAHISHGSTVTLLLPYVIEFNLISNPSRYAELATLLGEDISGLGVMDAAYKTVESVKRFAKDLGMPLTLGEVGITEADIPELVDDLMIFQAPAIEFMNPRDVTREDAVGIYMKAI